MAESLETLAVVMGPGSDTILKPLDNPLRWIPLVSSFLKRGDWVNSQLLNVVGI